MSLTVACWRESLLAMDQRFEPFSQGRGQITPQRVEEMWRMAQKHGIGLPPLINGAGSGGRKHAPLKARSLTMKSAEKGQVEFPELLFGMSWEDPESDRRALRIQPGDAIVTIGSGGCNTFEFLLEDPGRIFAVDINPCQSHLLEFKCAAVRRLDLDDLQAFLGLAPTTTRLEVFESLQGELSARALAYWRSRPIHRERHCLPGPIRTISWLLPQVGASDARTQADGWSFRMSIAGGTARLLRPGLEHGSMANAVPPVV